MEAALLSLRRAAGNAAVAAAASAALSTASSQTKPPPPRSWGAWLRWGAVGVVKIGAVAHVTFNYVAFFSSVNGPSMFPTFSGRGWNVVVAEALPGVRSRVGVGDVVIATRPIDARESVIKRVAAVEGQRVTLFSRGAAAPVVLEVPPGHVWLQGDNGPMSRDSREYGPVPLALVRGRVVCQVLPTFKWVTTTGSGGGGGSK